jgi:hypothetical protein
METIAFVSSMMFLAVFCGLFWLDRTSRNQSAQARNPPQGAPKDGTP